MVSLASGVYGRDQALSAETTKPGLSLHYSFRDADGAPGPWIPFRGPVALTAAPGERREYRGAVGVDPESGGEQREFSIIIDRRVPAVPRVLPEPGTYWSPVPVRFEVSAGDTVFYSIQGDVTRDARPWDGTGIVVGSPGAKAESVVQAYSVSPAGNRSRIVSARYSIDARPPILDVLSPVSGTFANPQALALSFRNLQWIRYSDDGSDPAAGGTPYDGPVTLRRQGTTRIRVAGQPRAAGSPVLRREVTVTYAPVRETGLSLDTENGIYPHGVSAHLLSSPPGSVYYTLWEKSPAESDFLASPGIDISGKTGGPSPVTLRLRSLSSAGSWGPEYRYFFFVGEGAPSTPSLARVDAAVTRGAKVQVNAPEDTLLAVTVDGSPPSPRSPVSSSWIDLPQPPGADSVIVRARAFGNSGTPSALMETRVRTGTGTTRSVPSPAFAFRAGPAAGTAVLGSAEQGSVKLVYEISSDGSDPIIPGPDSPPLSAPVSVTIPFGMFRTFKVRVASIDETGNTRAVSSPAAVTLDMKPPDRPAITPAPGSILDEPTSLKIDSPAKVYFVLSSDGTAPRDPDPSNASTGTFVALPGTEGSLTTYRLKLMAVGAAGYATEVYGDYLYSVDLRQPRLPEMAQLMDRGEYNSPQVSPSLGESPWIVRYSASSDGSDPPDPDQRSPQLTNATVFTGEEGAVTTWKLKMVAVSRNGKRLGERRSLSIAIDLQPPEVPALTGVPDGGRTARRVVLTAGQLPAGVRLLYQVTTDDSDPADPASAGNVFPAPLVLDVPDGVRRDFTVRIACVDSAGNRSLYDRRYRFTIDRELPDDPVVRAATDGAVSSSPMTLALESREALTVFELTDDGSMPRLPTPASRAYAGPLLLAGKPGASVTYHLLPRAYNDLGTASRAARVFTFTIDRTVPLRPPAPSVDFSPENPGVAYVSWQTPTVGHILYRLGPPGGTGDAEEFVLFTSPVSVAVDAARGSTIVGEALSETPAGLRSAPVPFAVTVGKRLPVPVFQGARNGTISTRNIVLRASGAGGEVRYELSTDGEYPAAVTPGSPVFPDPLALNAADGQTVKVKIAARSYDPKGAAIPSEEVTFEAAIDRTPPDPPVASGIEDGGYYQDSKVVPLLSAEGTIYYSLSTRSDPLIPGPTDANRYSGPLPLEARPGQSVTFHIVAFSVDEAGNRSREIKAWTVTIDQQVVYAAPTGKDFSDGTRGAPVRTVSRALQIAAATARKTVFVAAGQYTESSGVDVQGDFALVGGLDADTWQPLGLERFSTIRASAPWRTGTSLISFSSGNTSMKGFEIAGGQTPLAALLSVSGGSFTLEQSLLSLQGPSEGQAVGVSGGTFALVDCRMQATGSWAGSFVAGKGGTISLSGSRLAGPTETTDFVCVDLAGVRGATLKGVTVDPGSGLRTRGVRVTRAQVSVSGSRILSGTGAIEAIAFDARDSDIRVENSDVDALAAARFPTALQLSSSSVQVNQSRITLGGTISAVGISVKGGDLVLQRTTLRAAPTREYLSLVRLEDARSLVANNLFVGSSSGQSVGLQMKGGAADILNNTLVAGTGVTVTAGILVQGDQFPRLVNNIVTRKGPGVGVAVSVIDARRLLAPGAAPRHPVMLANALGGWRSVLDVEYTRDLQLKPLAVDTADGLNGLDGDDFSGPLARNRSETADASFRPGQGDLFKPARTSVCLDGGEDLTAAGGPGGTGEILLRKASDISADILGNPRPAPVPLGAPGPPRGWDIGAYEYSE